MASHGQSSLVHRVVVKEEEGLSNAQIEKIAATEEAHIHPALDRAITRKFDTHIIPWLFGLWLLAFIGQDPLVSSPRSNIGNARIVGLPQDLKLTGDKFNIALTVFYIPYILVDVPSNWLVKYLKAGYYLPGLLICWGVVSLCMGFTKSYAGLIVCRLLLGLFEGGLLGGMIIYLAMFYRRHQLLFRIGLFYCAAPLSGAFGGLLATGLAEINYGGYKSWPWIFIVEGAITVVFGIITLFFLPHTPKEAKFLTEEQRNGAIHRMTLDAHGASAASDVAREEFSWRWVRMALLNWNTILLSITFFLLITPIYSYSLFLPTIISTLGYKRVTAQLFTVPPNACAVISVLLVTYLSDKTKVRGPFMLGGCTSAIIGYIMLLAGKRPQIQYGGTFLIAVGVFPSSPLVMGWLANNSAPHYVRATATGFQICIANCAAFLATFSYLSKDAPKYIVGHSINLASLVLCIIFILASMAYQTSENRKRDKGRRDYRLAKGDEALLGFHHPHFRYTI